MNRENLKPISRTENIVVQELANEILIYDLKINKAFCLNETSALIWQLCDGRNSVEEIARLASKQIKSRITNDFVWLTLDQLKKNNLLENSSRFEIEFNGLSRREMIRQVGLSSLIALPLILSLSAPTSAQAASGLCAGKVCNDQNNCTIDTCNPANGRCEFLPKSCPLGQRCDQATGDCV